MDYIIKFTFNQIHQNLKEFMKNKNMIEYFKGYIKNPDTTSNKK